MLRELNIENLVLIDHLRITPREGMNVFTGETGSGKSMIIDALALLAGERGRSELIRVGSERLLVEGVFDWPTVLTFNKVANELGLDNEDNCIIVSRELTVNGRNTTRINGHSYPLSVLRTLAPYLLNIHAQEDTQELLSAAHYLTYLDQYDTDLTLISEQLTRQYEQYRWLSGQLTKYDEERQNWQGERDYIEFQYNEIEAAGLQPGEEEVLEDRRRLMRNASQILQVSQQIDRLLFNTDQGSAAEELLNQARHLIGRHNSEPALTAMGDTLDQAIYALDEVKNQLSRLVSDLDFEPAELEAVEERLYQLSRLFKKYGETSNEVLLTGQQLRERREQMSKWEADEQGLIASKEQAEAEYYRLAEITTNLRKKTAQQLEMAVGQQLSHLAMPHAKFVIQIEPTREPGAQGMDKVSFLFSDNPGQELRPVHKIASGGELSRLALAFQVILVNQIEAQAFVFDEIDAGMSGYALEQIAARIAALSSERQVLLVTHAPVVAAYADTHFAISKESQEDTTTTTAKELSSEEAVQHLVLMMGTGHAPESAYKYAQELKQTANSNKA